jgi:DNA-binding NarL/FixJ family response regulator
MIEAAEWSRAHGQRYAEMRALHDALRLQRDRRVAAKLADVSEIVEGPLARVLNAYGRALGDDDAEALDAVAAQFEDIGSMLHAAETATQVAAMFADVGLVSRSTRSKAHATSAAACCEDARSVVLEQLDQPVPLTTREHEVVRLASEGMSAREIAKRLVISTRTVEGHLQRAYTKLGVHDRQGLQRLLSATTRTGRS